MLRGVGVLTVMQQEDREAQQDLIRSTIKDAEPYTSDAHVYQYSTCCTLVLTAPLLWFLVCCCAVVSVPIATWLVSIVMHSAFV